MISALVWSPFYAPPPPLTTPMQNERRSSLTILVQIGRASLARTARFANFGDNHIIDDAKHVFIHVSVSNQIANDSIYFSEI